MSQIEELEQELRDKKAKYRQLLIEHKIRDAEQLLRDLRPTSRYYYLGRKA